MDAIYTQDDLLEIFLTKIRAKKYHQHYKHTVEKAHLYTSAMTGKNQMKYIVKWKIKEKKKQKERRFRLTHARTKSTCNRVLTSFGELSRSDNITDVLRYEGEVKESKEKVDKLKKMLSKFCHGKTANEWLIERIKELNFYDPNTFIVFEQRDRYTYPIEIYSSQVYAFEYKFGELQYLMSVVDEVIEGKKYKEFTMRAKGYQFKAKVAWDELKDGDPIEYETFTLEDVKVEYVPAIRVGFRLDAETHNDTAVGVLEPATEELEHMMWLGSEIDLHKKMHGFLQKFIYAPVCNYRRKWNNEDEECSRGNLSRSKEKCPKCDGQGLLVHKTVSDVVVLRKPNSAKAETVPLSNMVHYVQVPLHIIEKLDTDLDKTEERFIHTVFNSELFSRAQFSDTATAKQIELMNRYIIYSDLGRVMSRAIKMVNLTTAKYNNLDDKLICEHKFPIDFRLESLAELLDKRQKALAANAPYEVIRELDMRIIKIVNRDSPEEIERIKARDRFKVLRHLPINERVAFIATLPANHRDRISYHYFEDIFESINFDLAAKEQSFYELPYDKQSEVFEAKVQEFIERVPDSDPVPDIGL